MSIVSYQSTNIQCQYETNDYSPGDRAAVDQRARDFPAACEVDLKLICGWFGVSVESAFGSANRIIVTLDPNMGGGINWGYRTNNPPMTVGALLGQPFDKAIYNFAAEMIEILMTFPGTWSWNAGDSAGEGLSRAAADLLHPASAPATQDNFVNAWLASDPTTDSTAAVADDQFRKDWITTNFKGGPLKKSGDVSGDQDSYSFGCSLLFVNYLRDQLGYSMAQICQNGGGTMDGTYRNISHASLEGFSQFKRLLDVHFPGPGHKANSDNPYPLALTDVAPAAAGRTNNLFLFARMLDGRIIFNQAAPGGAFVGWQEVPGGVRTNTALAAGMQNQTLFVFARQADGSILFNQAAPGGAFVGWLPMPGGVTTDVALAAAGRQNNLFVLARAMDGRILYDQAAPGKAWVGWQEVPGGVRTNTALGAGMQKDTLFVFDKDPMGRILANQAPPGGAFQGWSEGL